MIIQHSEQELLRRQKLADIRALGIDPFPPALFPVSHLSTEATEKYSAELESEEMKQFDKEKLAEILNIRKFIYNNDENAAEFLNNIDDKRPVFKKSAKPELPF